MPKYSDIKVQLVGKDGNAFSIMGRCSAAVKLARRDGLEAPTGDEFNQFLDECTNCENYDKFLQKVSEWFETF